MSDTQSPPEPPSSPPPPPPPTVAPSQEPVAPGGDGNRSVMIVLSYLWLLALIPFLVEKQDREVQWHAKHGLVLTAAEVALWIVLTILNLVIGAIIAPLSCVLSLGFLLVFVALMALHVFCIVKGVGGERFLIPGLSEYADRF